MTLFTYDQLWPTNTYIPRTRFKDPVFPDFLQSAGRKGPQSLSRNHFKVLGYFRKSLDNPYQTTAKTQVLILRRLCEDPAISSTAPQHGVLNDAYVFWNLKWQTPELFFSDPSRRVWEPEPWQRHTLLTITSHHLQSSEEHITELL